MIPGKSTLLKTGKNLSLAIATLLFAAGTTFIAGCNRGDGGGGQPDVVPTLEMVGDSYASPLTVVEAPDNTQRRFVVDQIGKIWVIDASGRKLPTPFLDISASMVPLSSSYDERGLLGLAFHPNYRSNRKFYVFYTIPSKGGGPAIGVPWNNVSRISEFMATTGNQNIADPSSERVILEENHPAMNHNGGMLAFGPDGYLYISIGDGGDKDDVGPGHVSDWYAANAGGNAQNITNNLLGKVLRIDVNGNPYNIPADNPFVSSPGAKAEIYAFGFRNPYRFSFDLGGSHELFVGDAGQSLYEEIDLVTKGGNYGWNVKEGTACFNTDNNKTERPGCPTVDPMGIALSEPIIQLPNAANPAGGISTVIVGGYVYRGATFPQLQGQYIFGSYSYKGADGKLYFASASGASSGLRSYSELSLRDYETNLGQYVKGLGQDLSGEIYITTSSSQGPAGSNGRVFKVVAAK